MLEELRIRIPVTGRAWTMLRLWLLGPFRLVWDHMTASIEEKMFHGKGGGVKGGSHSELRKIDIGSWVLIRIFLPVLDPEMAGKLQSV